MILDANFVELAKTDWWRIPNDGPSQLETLVKSGRTPRNGGEGYVKAQIHGKYLYMFRSGYISK